jgi:hypothetical protein
MWPAEMFLVSVVLSHRFGENSNLCFQTGNSRDEECVGLFSLSLYARLFSLSLYARLFSLSLYARLFSLSLYARLFSLSLYARLFSLSLYASPDAAPEH